MKRAALSLALCMLAACAGEPAPESEPAEPAAAPTTPAAAPAEGVPERVRPGVISTDRNQTFPAVDPVDGSLWFSVYDDDFNRQTIMVAAREGDGWAEPVVAPFSGEFADRAPRFSPDGSRLYISSDRPGPDGARDIHVWAVTRSADGWGRPERLPAPVNVDGSRDNHASATNAALWVASTRPGGQGRSDTFRIPNAGTGWGEAQAMPWNDALSQSDLLVAPDEQWAIIVITDHPDGLGGDDLFLVRREGDGWSAPEHLPAPINTAEYEYGPSLSPDGVWLYFTSHRDGTGDVWRVPVATLGIRRLR